MTRNRKKTLRGQEESTDVLGETRIMRKDQVRPREGAADCLVCIYGGPLGRRFELGPSPITIGRVAECDIQLDQDTVSRRHARIDGGQSDRTLADLGSTNGLYVNERRVEQHHLVPGDYVKIGDVILKYLAGNNIENVYHEEIYRLAIEDGLTRLSNKRFLLSFLDREFLRARRFDRPLSLMMLDLDHFKAVNDHFGHLAGDAVLSQLGQILQPRVRKVDCLGRYGGEEFCLVMPETSIEGASRLTRLVCQMVATARFAYEDLLIPVTVSAGVAERSEDMESYNDLLALADSRLLRAKESGRNRMVNG